MTERGEDAILKDLSASFDEMYRRMVALIDKSEQVYNAKLDGLERLIQTRLDGADKALEVKTIDMDRRLGELNRLREEVISDRAQYIRSDVYEAKHSVLENDWRVVATRLAVVETTAVTNESKIQSLVEWKDVAEKTQQTYLKSREFLDKIKTYDIFVGDTRDRITKIETQLVTWTASVSVIFILIQMALEIFFRK